MARYRYNRAVGAHNKGDEFEADPNQLFVQSLLGAGYAEPVTEPDDGADEGEPSEWSEQTQRWYQEKAP